MKRTALFLTLALLGSAAVYADSSTKADSVEQAIKKNQTNVVKALAALSTQHKIGYSAAAKTRYIALAKEQVTKQKNAGGSIRFNRNALKDPGALLTLTAQSTLLVFGLWWLYEAWEDKTENNKWKTWSLFGINLGQSINSVGTIYKTLWTYDDGASNVKKAEKVLTAVDGLPTQE